LGAEQHRQASPPPRSGRRRIAAVRRALAAAALVLLAGLGGTAGLLAPTEALAQPQAPDPQARRRPEPQRPTTCRNYGSTAEVTGAVARLPGEGPGSDPRTRQVLVLRIETPFCMRAVVGVDGVDLPGVPNLQLILKPEDFVRWQRLLAMPRLRATGKLVARKDPAQRTLVVMEVTGLEEPPRP
jgi:hypothetical protein